MLVRILTLRFSTALDGFDDASLVDFIKDKVVLSLKEYFFIKNETPYLAIIINYEAVAESTNTIKKGERRGSRDEAWRSLLQDKDMPLFDSLRSWRAEYCKKEGVPPYIICKNEELAKIVVAKPQSITALIQIDGFGKAKAEKYGKAILEVLKINTDKQANTNIDKQQNSDKELADGNSKTK